MKCHAIVPVKTLYQAKSRLAEVLTPAARHALVLEML
ncbi:MAG: 2-phospho-L-lactate guanylyltransferase, partial [Chloroflexia bacterium]|nr:2-phospho-L-lactate guanylyltransferase [Chloroflexia bacterium]